MIDDDKLDDTNMKRGAGRFPTDVGRFKVDVIKEHFLKINPAITAMPQTSGAGGHGVSNVMGTFLSEMATT